MCLSEASPQEDKLGAGDPEHSTSVAPGAAQAAVGVRTAGS